MKVVLVPRICSFELNTPRTLNYVAPPSACTKIHRVVILYRDAGAFLPLHKRGVDLSPPSLHPHAPSVRKTPPPP